MPDPRTSRITGTASRANSTATTETSPTAPSTDVSPGPGTRRIRDTLGVDGTHMLHRYRCLAHTAIAVLADLVTTTAHEADRLHTHLRHQATYAHDRYRDALTAPGGYVEVTEVASIQQHPAHAATIYAARLEQQLHQLDHVLAAYRTATTTPHT